MRPLRLSWFADRGVQSDLSFMQNWNHFKDGQIAGCKGEKDPRRKFGRLKCSMAHCTLGEIMDLSAGGMRVITRVKLKSAQRESATLITQHGALPVTFIVRWARRTKLFWFEAGVEFVDLDDRSKRLLNEFARVACETNHVRMGLDDFIKVAKESA
jgi:hypothetical protein